MRGLFWNCRGIKKKGVAPYIRDMVRECNFDFVCFQETIAQEFSDECFRKNDLNKKFLWD
jgi:exonuclease III